MASAKQKNTGNQTTHKRMLTPKVPHPANTSNAARNLPEKAPTVQRKETISSAHRTRTVVIPEKSHEAARAVFKHFNQSKYAAGALPSNHVPTVKTATGLHRVATPQQVLEFQKKQLGQHLRKISKLDTPNRGMTVALSKDARQKVLPTFNANTGKVDLDDVMNLLEKNMRGTEFFSKGNPVLNRLALRARAQQILLGMSKDKR